MTRTADTKLHIALRMLLLVLVLATPAFAGGMPVIPPQPLPFSQPFDSPAGDCVCTPLLMNTSVSGSQTWWVKASGGPLGVHVIAHAVNGTDPENVNAQVFDAVNNPFVAILNLTASYGGGQTPGFEAIKSGSIANATAGAFYRVTVTTPSTPSTQAHYRLRFTGAEAVGTASPSSPSFEHDSVIWYFNTGANEAFHLRVFVTGTPATSSTLDYTLVAPNGSKTSGVVTATNIAPFGPVDAFIDANAMATAGTWALRINSASDHYALDKNTGSDRGIYLSWKSAGEGSLHITAVAPVSGGAPFTGATAFSVQNEDGVNVGNGVTNTGSIDFTKLPPGQYRIDMQPPAEWTAVTPFALVTVFCDTVTSSEFVLSPVSKITVDPASGIYGGTTTLTATLSAGGAPLAGKTVAFFLNLNPVGTAVTNAGGVASLSNADLSGISAGSYNDGVSASFAGDAVYHPVAGTNTLTVSKKSAAVTPAAASKTYGTGDPAFTGTLTGFLASDNVTATYSRTAGESVLGGPYTISATLSPASPVGVLSNYVITTGTANFTITPASASVAPAAASKTYGTADPALTGTLTGFLAGDNVTATYSRTAGESVLGGPYTISATLSPASLLDNYIITVSTANFTINPATLIVAPATASKTYGATDPVFTGTLVGSIAGDNITATYSRTAGENVAGNPYTISATLNSSSALSNYTVVSSTASFTINPAIASVAPAAASKTYGTADPAFTGTLTGFLASDNVTAVYSRTAGESVLGGPYTISATLSPASLLDNYIITVSTANFTINPATLIVTPAAASKTYGATDPAFTGTLVGSIAGDSITATYSRTAGESVAGNPYTISATLNSSSALSNYTVVSNTASFTINPAIASVTPAAASKMYGGAEPALTGTLSGFLPADGVTASYSRTAGENVAGSPYTISAALSPAGVLGNYTITTNTANFTIAPAPLTVTANNATKIYGASTPNAGVIFTGLVNQDTPISIGGAVASSGTSSTDPVGTYPIVAGGLTNPNYSITFVNGTLLITPAPLSIAVTNTSKTYGTANPAFVATYSGLIASDTPGALGGTLAFTTSAATNSSVGSYAVSPSGLTSPNYNITFTDGTLTVNPASLTVTANDATKVAGTANPSFTASFTGLVNSDTADSLGALTLSTTATTASPAGTYSIVPSGLAAANYAVTYFNGLLTVTPASITNNPPHAKDDSATTLKNTPVTVNVLANDSDPEGDVLSIASVSTASNGSTVTTAGGILYTPNTGFTGTDMFSYKISDGHGGTDVATVKVLVVRSTNHPPDAYDDSAKTAKNTPVTINVLANDTDPDGDALSITNVSHPDHGTTTIVAGKVVYTPNNGFTGTDCFTYSISDGHGGTDYASVRVMVGGTTGTNHAPDANDDSAVTAKNTSVSIPVLANDTDADGNTLSISGVSNPDHGSAAIYGTSIRYTPDSGFTGIDTFNYKISDGHGGSDVAIVRVTVVASANHAPNAMDDSAITARNTSISINVLANDSDPDGDALTINGVTGVDHGTVTVVGGMLQYTPAANYTGTDCFTYSVSDGHGGTDTASVRVTITSTATSNRSPYARNDSVNTAKNTAVTIDVLANDTDPDHDPLSIADVSSPSHGTATVVSGKVLYRPNTNFTGRDTFTYQISDGRGGTNSASVTVKVGSTTSGYCDDDDDSDAHHRSDDDGHHHWDN